MYCPFVMSFDERYLRENWIMVYTLGATNMYSYTVHWKRNSCLVDCLVNSSFICKVLLTLFCMPYLK
jgi:hypothetical protein